MGELASALLSVARHSLCYGRRLVVVFRVGLSRWSCDPGMNRRRVLDVVFVLLALLVAACTTTDGGRAEPLPPREFRAMWVATVANIDWPSKPGLDSDTQRAEAIALLDMAVDVGLNAVILQVRPHCDALFPSEIEPWSSYLSGQQGEPPTPYYDPLQFWIEESHARGLELHAWFNPYRADHPGNPSGLAPESVAVQHPEWVATLGDKGFLWLDPAQEPVPDHSIEVILDVVRRYDVDGVHLDDYFYPYPSYNDGDDFPDDVSWTRYVSEGGGLSRSDWRRSHVDRFVERLYREVKRTRKTVRVGISPFGIWRPAHPESIEGMDQHEVLFADARRWLQEGWVDYFAPQLYWPVSQVPQSFPTLLAWWIAQNDRDRHLWPGLYSSRVSESGWSASEVVGQILVSRAMLPQSEGHIHFSAKVLAEDRLDPEGVSLRDELSEDLYRSDALVPASPWLDADPPPAPVVIARYEGDVCKLIIASGDDEEPFLYVIYAERAGRWDHEIVSPMGRSLALHQVPVGSDETKLSRVTVRAVDRLGNEGPAWVSSRHDVSGVTLE